MGQSLSMRELLRNGYQRLRELVSREHTDEIRHAISSNRSGRGRSRQAGDALLDLITGQPGIDAVRHANVFVHQIRADGLIVGHGLRMLQAEDSVPVTKLVR